MIILIIYSDGCILVFTSSLLCETETDVPAFIRQFSLELKPEYLKKKYHYQTPVGPKQSALFRLTLRTAGAVSPSYQ